MGLLYIYSSGPTFFGAGEFTLWLSLLYQVATHTQRVYNGKYFPLQRLSLRYIRVGFLLTSSGGFGSMPFAFGISDRLLILCREHRRCSLRMWSIQKPYFLPLRQVFLALRVRVTREVLAAIL